MRHSFDGLSAPMRHELGADPTSGCLATPARCASFRKTWPPITFTAFGVRCVT